MFSLNNRSIKINALILAAFIAAKFILQYFAIDPVYELHRDEYLHIDLGRHLAFGYTSVPPVTGLISALIVLLGKSVFWVKFFPALFGAGIIYAVWKTVEALGGGLFARVLAASGILFSTMVRINMLYQPNSLDYLCWTLMMYTLIRFLQTKENRWIYATAVVFALGILNKYNIGFLAMGMFPAILVSRQRSLLRNRHVYLAGALAVLIILPNLIWQVRNGLPVLHHMRTLAATQLVNVNRTDFLVEQLYFFTGSLLIILFGLIALFTYERFREYRLFFYTFIFTLAIFTWLRAKNYYAVGLYPVFIAFGAVYLEHLLSSGWLKYLRILLLAGPLLSFIPMYTLLLPVLSPDQVTERKETFDRFNLTRWEDGEIHQLPQDYADMLGWKELAAIVDSALLTLDDPEHTIVHCDNYGQAGAVNYYSTRLKTGAFSMNADYINWYPLDEFEIRNIVQVKEVYDDDPGRSRERQFFEEVSRFGSVSNPYAREYGTTVFVLRNATQSINDILREEIRERKSRR